MSQKIICVPNKDKDTNLSLYYANGHIIWGCMHPDIAAILKGAHENNINLVFMTDDESGGLSMDHKCGVYYIGPPSCFDVFKMNEI